ncbi:hypothetical protein [Gelidibacter gilvus]|uniref:DUF1360 domain-containing protein n=1 Tax=Gelidibacter gilvus TaxID=59602 RepID=A0A4Q0XEI5_9FLAO|nr:hypothetical protein [Gelidibacter gilvus]RXJ44315.1 hypothetical protein ESZ48_18100 [Gelidibacter gilvus]
MQVSEQVAHLFLLAIPIACISWTITQEELFKEPRDICTRKSESCKTLLQRKFFYVFTCEYCFSHYVTLAFVIMTQFHLLFPDWRGYIIGGFSLVWIANVYMSLFRLIRVEMKKENIKANIEKTILHEKKNKTE